MGSKHNNRGVTRSPIPLRYRTSSSKGALRRIAKNERRARVRFVSPEQEIEAVITLTNLITNNKKGGY